MTRVFERLALWVDPLPRHGPAQMACDEFLLTRAAEPVLRIFRWDQSWVSIGYFISWQEAVATQPELPVCRRWTGGGVVVHDGDFTFSLAAPRSEAWAQLRPEESYRVLHVALAEALREAGSEAALFDDHARAGAACFAGPVRYDVMDGPRKVAGGAQRRTKRGLLHQGSIRHPGLDPGFATRLAAALAAETTPWSTPPDFEEGVGRLTRDKYARDEFLRKGEP
jgi:lipoate-protein ligase A